MTDDPNLDPNGLPADEEPVEGSGGEAADDLDAAQLEAAAEGAEEEVDDEAEDDTIVEEEGGIEAAPLQHVPPRRLQDQPLLTGAARRHGRRRS